jgi:hypothetical protein
LIIFAVLVDRDALVVTHVIPVGTLKTFAVLVIDAVRVAVGFIDAWWGCRVDGGGCGDSWNDYWSGGDDRRDELFAKAGLTDGKARSTVSTGVCAGRQTVGVIDDTKVQSWGNPVSILTLETFVLNLIDTVQIKAVSADQCVPIDTSKANSGRGIVAGTEPWDLDTGVVFDIESSYTLLTLIVLNNGAVGDCHCDLLGLALTVWLEKETVGALDALVLLDNVAVETIGDKFPALAFGVGVESSDAIVASSVDESGAVGVRVFTDTVDCAKFVSWATKSTEIVRTITCTSVINTSAAVKFKTEQARRTESILRIVIVTESWDFGTSSQTVLVVSFCTNQAESGVAGVNDLAIFDFGDDLFGNAGSVLSKIEGRNAALALSSGEFICCAVRVHGVALSTGHDISGIAWYADISI